MLDDIIDLMIRVTFLGMLICASFALFGMAYQIIIKGIM